MDEALKFALACLNDQHPRDDYRELLELTVIYMGGVPPRGIRIMAPGQMHRARWMAKAKYALNSCFGQCYFWHMERPDNSEPSTFWSALCMCMYMHGFRLHKLLKLPWMTLTSSRSWRSWTNQSEGSLGRLEGTWSSHMVHESGTSGTCVHWHTN